MIRYKRSAESSIADLDADDLELIQMLAEGHTVKDIANGRGIKPTNLNYQLRKVFTVLGASRIPHVIHIAWQRGILKASEPCAK